MANRFSFAGTPGPTKAEKEFRERELRLAERKADPGYQFLNAGLSTLASTLGNLAVNAAGYELFGGRKRDDLAESDFKFRQKKFKDELDLQDRTLQFNRDKEQFANIKSSADATSKTLAARAFTMDQDALDAAFNSLSGPKTRTIEVEQIQEPKVAPAANVVQIPGGGSAYEVSNPDDADFGYEGKHYISLAEGEVPPGEDAVTLPLERKMVQKEEAIDYFADLDETGRNDAQFLAKGLRGLGTALQKLPDGSQKDALINQYAVSMGLTKGGARFLREAASQEGVSVNVSPTQTSINRSRPRGKSGTGRALPKDWGKLQGAAAFAGIRYTDYYNAVQNPGSTESKAILGDDYGNPKAQQRKLKRLGENAQRLHDRLRDHQKTEEIGGFRYQSPTAADLKNYSEGGALGRGQAKKERAAITQKKADWKSNTSLADEESTISLSAFSNAELKELGLDDNDINILKDSDPTNLGNRKRVYLKARNSVSGGDKNSPEWARLRQRLLMDSVARDRRKAERAGGKKASADAWYSADFSTSFKTLSALDSAGLDPNKEFKNNGFWDKAVRKLGSMQMGSLVKSAAAAKSNLKTLKGQVQALLKQREAE